MGTRIPQKRDLRVLFMRGAFALQSAGSRRAAAISAASRLGKARQLVFCITTGRSGSATLAEYFGCLAAVDARHEPEPKLSWLMRQVQADEKFAEDFWLYRKLPAIARLGRHTYVETSNLFGKGFFDPLMRIGVVPDLLLLRRDRRSVARSLYRLDWIPGRTKYGRLFFLQPDDRVLRPVPNWQRLTDYQLCYWQTLEMKARKEAYAEAVRRHGRRAVWVDLGLVARPGYFESVAADLGIPVTEEDRGRIERIRGRIFNEKEQDTVRACDASRIEVEEAEVLALARPAPEAQNI